MNIKILLPLLLITSLTIFSQEVTVEFNNKPITDIIIALAEINNRNIIADSTITGNRSFFFTSTNPQEALSKFLKANSLYINQEDNVEIISKIFIENTNKNITLKCNQVSIIDLLEKLNQSTEKPILYNTFPSQNITLNLKNRSIDNILKIIVAKLKNYKVVEEENYYYILEESRVVESSLNGEIKINKIGNRYNLSVVSENFITIIDKLFKVAQKEYQLIGNNSSVISGLEYKNKTFQEILKIVLDSGFSDYTSSNGIYYIFPSNNQEIESSHYDNEIIKLKNILVKDLLNILPSAFLNSNVIKTNSETNTIILFGTTNKIEPILKFITLVDKDLQREPRWIIPKYISTESLKEVLKKEYSPELFVNIDNSSFIMHLSNNEFYNVQTRIKTIDIPLNRNIIKLKYIKSDQLLENIPKGFNKEQILKTPDPTLIYFYGDNDKYNEFIEAISKIDTPVPQLKYKVLVIQKNLGSDSKIGLNTKLHSKENGDITVPDGDWNSYSGNLGSLLGLNFNVLSAFGPLFSFELNASLNNNKSKVLVDTTLKGLSGKSVSFRNTTTSRFYQTTVDSDGNRETGAAQEVSWGIIMDIEGWTSGNGMVTIDINATISDETTLSGEYSGIPSTSEKIVNTHVRTEQGKPVVIGGLISSKKESVNEKTPILGDIPIIGNLFKRKTERETKSEFSIYLIPYIEESVQKTNRSLIEEAYKELIDE